MQTIARDRTRQLTKLDAIARSAASVFPFLTRAFDQARLDARVLVDSLSGRHPRPARDRRRGLLRPPSLDEIDPVAPWLPGFAARRYLRVTRDLSVVFGQLRGRHPSPLITQQVRGARKGTAKPAGGAAATARRLVVTRVDRPTPSSTSFELSSATAEPLRFEPGQFFTILFELNGVVHRRAYSASNRRGDGVVRLVAKRVEGGLVSNAIGDRLVEGMSLDVLGPSGSFVWRPKPGLRREIVLIGGGSGITPLMAILYAVLEDEPESDVTLVYGNRSIDEVIFREELDDLEAVHERLRVRHVLMTPPEGWAGGSGLLDGAGLARELDALEAAGEGAEIEEREYFLCGPQPMMDAARATLEARGVPEERVHEERFVRAGSRGGAGQSRPTSPQPVILRREGREYRFDVPVGDAILDAGLAAGAPMRFSCAMGGCAECRLRLVEGEVGMEEPNCLTSSERDDGYVLTCVGWPLGPVILEAD